MGHLRIVREPILHDPANLLGTIVVREWGASAAMVQPRSLCRGLALSAHFAIEIIQRNDRRHSVIQKKFAHPA